jgi:hypothetical protein
MGDRAAMRLALAALITTIVPTIIGSRWVDGPRSVRYGLGSLVGVALVGFGGIIGGLTNALIPAVVVTLVAGWFLAPGCRLTVPRQSPGNDTVIQRTLVFVVVVGSCLMLLAILRPIPAWDGWMNWSLKAKALALDGHFFGPVFTSPEFRYSHQDYPTLLPAWQALAYIISGQLTISWPLQFQLAWLWTAAAVGLVSLVSSQCGRTSLFLMAWICAPQVIYWTMSGYADVPMAFFLVAGIGALLLSPSQPPVVAGFLLGACALTKAEGLPFAVLAVLSVSMFSVQPKIPLQALAILLGVRSPWLLFTIVMGIPNDIVNAASLHPQRVITLIPRIVPIGEAWISELVAVRRWGLLVVAASVALIMRWKPRKDLVAAALAYVGVLTFIYVITPRNLPRQLASTVGRVAIAPLGLLALSLATGKPGLSVTRTFEKSDQRLSSPE